MTFNIGDKVRVVDTYTLYHVVKAKKGSIGIIKEFCEIGTFINGTHTKIEGCKLEMKSGEIKIPLSYLTPYAKIERKTIKSLNNEELVAKYNELIRSECYATSTTSKTYIKIQKDIVLCEAELLSRLNNE